MSLIEKICPVCGNKFEVEERLADRELYCTLGCCLQADGERSEKIAVGS
ncbi:hypothetical protein [Methanohalophilus halophilus]|uniref:Uncharacterized protein n=1 Tax=Methanohalophilus halophilus TaxID=2177 RepID=A0A1H2R6K0_9EURY|nr:hypothetical protein [Methanohalophilus halophilus]SDW14760.1 hypothetical protein SAMN04515625_0443 [Methanohalophilus halophilus]